MSEAVARWSKGSIYPDMWADCWARPGCVELTNLGIGGSALLYPFMVRTMRDTPADVISLKTGTRTAGHPQPGGLTNLLRQPRGNAKPWRLRHGGTGGGPDALHRNRQLQPDGCREADTPVHPKKLDWIVPERRAGDPPPAPPGRTGTYGETDAVERPLPTHCIRTSQRTGSWGSGARLRLPLGGPGARR